MNRRAFFATLLGGAAAAADPERLLWTPGRKLISIPPTQTRTSLLAWYAQRFPPEEYVRVVHLQRMINAYHSGIAEQIRLARYYKVG